MSPVVDAHHHLLDPARFDYPWLTPEVAAIDRRFGPEDLAPELAAAGIDRTILVQTIGSLEETREFLATAAAVPFIGGVIGWVDLTDPGISGTLDALRGGPGGEWLVGIRHQVHDEPDPDWLLRPGRAARAWLRSGQPIWPTTSWSARGSCRLRWSWPARCPISGS